MRQGEHDPRVLEMHNAYKGRVFVMGNGPSLREQLPLLKRMEGEYTMGCNSLLMWRDFPFTPAFYGVSDVPGAETLEKVVFPEHDMQRFNVAWPERWQRHDRYIYVEKAPDSVQVQTSGTVGLGDTLPPIPTGRTTPLTIAQLALWFGFTELYFLGIEQTRGYAHDPDAVISFSGRQEFPADKNPRYKLAVQRCAQRMRDDMAAEGRAIYDCTPGGFLNETGRGLHDSDAPHKNILPYRDLATVLEARRVGQARQKVKA